jgi:Ca2+-binding RTX toxin-like protein
MYLSNDTAHARTWPLPQGAWWEFRIPVKSTRTISGENFYSFVKVIDGNFSPVLATSAPMYVFNAAQPPPQPPVTIDYANPSTISSVKMPDGVTNTKYGLYSQATINVWQRGGYWSMDLGTTTSYGQSLTPQSNVAGFDTWTVSFDWDNAPVDVLTVDPGVVYHWRAKWRAGTSGAWTYGADQTFVRPQVGATCGGKAVTVFAGLGELPTDGDDVILGTTASESLAGGKGNDTICGGGGNDFFTGGQGSDTIIGNAAGSDVIDFEDDPLGVGVGVSVNLAAGTGGGDTFSSIEGVIGSSGNDSITGDAGPNFVLGLAGNDTINVAGGNDGIDGGAGNDTLIGGGGNDRLVGGAGTDTASYGGLAAVTVNLGSTAAQNTVGAGTDTISTVENLIGSSGSDTLTGSAGANRIDGASGNDTIRGLGGNDVLIGGAGTDTVSYAGTAAVKVNLGVTVAQNTVGAGTDTISTFENLVGSSGSDTLTGSAGANRIDGASGNDTIRGAAGNDTLIGGLGTDTASYAGTVAVKVTLGTTAAQNTLGAGVDKLSGFENLIGSSKGDTLTGNGLKNRIDGGAGNDKLNGAAGTDTCIGGLGTDTATSCEVKSGIP